MYSVAHGAAISCPRNLATKGTGHPLNRDNALMSCKCCPSIYSCELLSRSSKVRSPTGLERLAGLLAATKENASAEISGSQVRVTATIGGSAACMFGK